VADLVELHQRRRDRWIVGAAVLLVGTVALYVYLRPVAPLLASATSWIWCVVGAAYHQGWLHGHRQEADRG
jgi:hypothetical protein